MAECPGAPVKQFKSYAKQIELLESRGMQISNRAEAMQTLQNVSYYRLSGYWYSFRKLKADETGRTDSFIEGSSFSEVLSLYEFDARLRTAVLRSLEPIELAFRARLGHVLGESDPLIHLKPESLGPQAKGNSDGASQRYLKWRSNYDCELARSREDFVNHHNQKYGGRLPVWAAVEILDWGGLTHLFGMAPQGVRNSMAGDLGLTGPQLESWMKSLNIVRNTAAHNGRLFNRVYTLTPRLPRQNQDNPLLTLTGVMNRCFGQLSLIQYLLHHLKIGNYRLLPAVLQTYPPDCLVPLSHTGTPNNWISHPLWN